MKRMKRQSSVVYPVSCDEAMVEVARRRRLGDLDSPARRDIDRDLVVIAHQFVDDSVAASGERPAFDEFPPLGTVTAATIDDRTLLMLARECRPADR
ncbi:MAG: hypothetical protein GY925_22850 [Actinomycetia bacterium]|nr:hypothetical protein [Actinomycetes bacterium]